MKNNFYKYLFLLLICFLSKNAYGKELYINALQIDVDKEKKGIPTRGRLPKLERSLVTKKRGGKIKGYKKGRPNTNRKTGAQIHEKRYHKYLKCKAPDNEET